jgi:hypothetical protein
MPAFTRENLLFSFTFFGHCIPLLYPSDKNGHNVRIPFRCRCALSAFPPKRQAPFIKLTRLHTLIDAGRGRRVDVLFFHIVLFLWLSLSSLFLNLSAPDHLLTPVGIGDGCRGLHPILVQHWAMSDMVAVLTCGYGLGPGAEFFEPSTSLF